MNLVASLAEFGGEGGQAPHTRLLPVGKRALRARAWIWTGRPSLHSDLGTLRSGSGGTGSTRGYRLLTFLSRESGSSRRGGGRRRSHSRQDGTEWHRDPHAFLAARQTWRIDPRTLSSELGRQPGGEAARHPGRYFAKEEVGGRGGPREAEGLATALEVGAALKPRPPDSVVMEAAGPGVLYPEAFCPVPGWPPLEPPPSPPARRRVARLRSLPAC